MNRRRAIRLRLLELDPRCQYCGSPLDERSATLDHKLPRRVGGPNAQSNLTLACRPCNRRKGGLTIDELQDWTAAVVAVIGGAS